MRGVATAGFILVMAYTAAMQTRADLYVLELHYETVIERAGSIEEIVETGMHAIGLDGSYRGERTRAGGATTIEIRRAGGESIRLHPSRRQAYVTPAGIPLLSSPDGEPRLVPDGGLERLAERVEEPTEQVGNIGIGADQVALGSRVVSGIALEGMRQVTVRPGGREMTAEWWFYFPAGAQPGGPSPVVAESRIGGDGVYEVRRMVRVTNSRVPDDHFEIPDDYTVVNLQDPASDLRRSLPGR